MVKQTSLQGVLFFLLVCGSIRQHMRVFFFAWSASVDTTYNKIGSVPILTRHFNEREHGLLLIHNLPVVIDKVDIFLVCLLFTLLLLKTISFFIFTLRIVVSLWRFCFYSCGSNWNFNLFVIAHFFRPSQVGYSFDHNWNFSFSTLIKMILKVFCLVFTESRICKTK